MGHAQTARGPDTALAPQALLNLLARRRCAGFGSISHLLWLTGLCAALATLLTVLSTASYRFIWATTLLAPDTFVWLTQAIGWLPGVAGFRRPTPPRCSPATASRPCRPPPRCNGRCG